MADEAKTIKDAQEADKKIQAPLDQMDLEGQQIDRMLRKREKSLEDIDKRMTSFDAEVARYKVLIGDARKTLDALKKFKTPAAQSAAKRLTSAIEGGDEYLKTMTSQTKAFKTVWTSSWNAEKALREALEGSCDLGAQSATELQRLHRDIKTQLDALGKQLDLLHKSGQAAKTDGPPSSTGSPAPNAAAKALKAVVEELTAMAKRCAAQITTAESACASITGALKGEGAAYHPDLKRLVVDGRKLGQDLAALAKSARNLFAQAAAGIKQGKGVLQGQG